MSRDGWAALPRGAKGLSAVCDCGISWSYSLFLYAFFSLIRDLLFKYRCQKAERSQASSIKTLFWENWRTTTKFAAQKQDLSMSDFCMMMHPPTRHALWLTFWSQRRLPSFRTLRIRQTWPSATIFSFQNLNINYLEGDTIPEMPLDLLFISVRWVSPLMSMKNASKNGLTGEKGVFWLAESILKGTAN